MENNPLSQIQTSFTEDLPAEIDLMCHATYQQYVANFVRYL